MVWFKVDDKAHANTKIRNVLATCPAALSLWTVAGSWVADELNDGFVPDSQLPWLMPAGAEELAQALVAARLWRRVRGGYLFHEWHKDGDGTKRNPTREEVLAEREKKAEAGRKGGLVSGQRRSAGKNSRANEKNWHDIGDASSSDATGDRKQADDPPKQVSTSGKARSKTQAPAEANAEARASHLLQPPTRPDPPPSKEGGEGSRAPRFAHGAARSPLETPASPTAPNGSMPDLDRRAQLAAQARAAIKKRRPDPARDRHDQPPDKAQTALDALNQAVADLTPATERTSMSQHIVELGDGGGLVVHHPLDDEEPCMIDQHIAGVGLPGQPGRYRTKFDLNSGLWTWEPVAESTEPEGPE